MVPVANLELPGALPVAATAVAILAVAILVSRQRRSSGDEPGQGAKPIPNPFPFWRCVACLKGRGAGGGGALGWRASARACSATPPPTKAALLPPRLPLRSDLALDVTVKGDFPDPVKQHAAFGPVFWWRFLGRRLLMVGDYEANMRLLKGEHTIGALEPACYQLLHASWSAQLEPAFCNPSSAPRRAPECPPRQHCRAVLEGCMQCSTPPGMRRQPVSHKSIVRS